MNNEQSRLTKWEPVDASCLTIGDLERDLDAKEMKDVQGGDWSGYWTWDVSSRKWNWTWVWSSYEQRGWEVS
jgi:hypothetical protein